MTRRRFLVATLLATALPGAGRPWAATPAADSAPVEIAVYAATSLRDAMARVQPICEAATGTKLVLNLGASNELARQIRAANKADVFISADEDWMNTLAEAGLVDTASRRRLLSNGLVVVGPADSPLAIRGAADLAAPGVRRLALADPAAVPAGRYARAWLERQGVWERVRDRVVPGMDVRAALAAVEAGAVEAGIVYRTDMALARQARILFEVPPAEGPAISYPAAALDDRPHLETARRVVDCLASPAADEVFRSLGFIVPDEGP